MEYRLRKNGLLVLALVMSLGALGQNVQAQNFSGENPLQSKAVKTYEVPKGPVELYGQVLDPYLDYYEKPGQKGYVFIEKYNAYRWDDMRYLVPELLPDAKEKKMSAEQLCDMLVALDKGYLNEMERHSYELAAQLVPHFPNLETDLEFLDELDMRLRSKSFELTQELIDFMPEGWDQRVMVAKDLKIKTWALSTLRDAALFNCPAYAKQRGYGPYVGPLP